jgi:tripartite-type tricarboxylate transporter receptor subunit TctC
MNTFFRACAVTLAVVAAAFASAVAAQDFPNKPIRLIIPYPAGGATDLTSRAFVSVAEEHLGQPMIVQIRTGGGGAVGAESALKSKPDGYTLFVGDPATHIILPNVQKVPYDPANFVPIGQLVALPGVLVVRSEAPWKTAKEFVDDALKNAGKYKHAAVTFSPEHLMFETLGVKWKVKLTHVPAQGGGPSLQALLGGHVDINALYPPVAAPHLQSGKLRALGLAGVKRWPLLPDVPTLPEQGYDLTATLWLGVFGQKGSPEPVLAKLREGVKKITEDASFKTMMPRMGIVPEYLTAEELQKRWDTERVTLKSVIDQVAKK